MTFGPRQRRRANRSNAYSKSKYTNWRRFDPYQGEITALPRNLTPTRSYDLLDEGACQIFERPVHEAFIRPINSNDVAQMMDNIPREYLKGLSAIYLLGGTWKQEKIAFSPNARWGAYGQNIIYLYALPRIHQKWYYKGLPKPDFLQEYIRAGAKLEQEKDGWSCQFDLLSLKKFYLFDVLIHEIGHHVDRHDLFSKSVAKAESFAEWFVREHGYKK